MFKEIFFLEIKGALRQPMIYIFMFIMALMVFGAVSSDNVIIGGTVGNVHKNAPHIVATYTLILTLLSLLIAAAFFNNAALRDHTNQFNEILFSTPLGKPAYFLGRFFGAWVLSTIPLLGIYIGFILATIIAPAAGWLEPERLGPIYFNSFVSTYLIFVLPNMFVAGAIIFALANKWKNTIVSFMGALGLIIIYSISGTLLSDIDNQTIGSMLDTFGIRTYFIDTKYFTPSEKNTIIPSLNGLVLWNRLTWMIIGTAILLLSYWSFSFKTKKEKVKKMKLKDRAEKSVVMIELMPKVTQSVNNSTFWKQFMSFFKTSFLSIVKNPTFKILFLFSLVLYIVTLVSGFEYYGLKSFPVTYKMVDSINEAAGLFVIIILVFFSGEIIWRDRLHHINEVIDATPHLSISSLLGKVLALVSVVSILHFLLIILGVGYQAINGYTHFQFDVYTISFVLGNLPTYIAWSAVLVFFQVVINQRYIAYFVSILFIFMIDILWAVLDIQSNMVSIGSTPLQMYSDMNGFGDAITGSIWFNAYWVLLGFVLLAASALLWTRGKVSLMKERLAIASKSMNSSSGYAFFGLLILWLACAGFVYYNSQILNPYTTTDERELLQVEYEQKYKQYEAMPIPKITDVDYTIDIFPDERKVEAKATISLANTSGEEINELHFSTDKSWNTVISIPNAEMTFQDENDLYRIYSLSKPFMAGETMNIEVMSHYLRNGFENEVENNSIAANGTFINNWDILPTIGYSDRFELDDKNDRRSYGLPAKARMPKLEYPCGKACDVNYLTDGRADWVNVHTTISTSGDQLAIAPGSLKKEWQQDGRNYYEYELDHPSQNFYSFMSANYEVKRKTWNGIDIEVYYDQEHGDNVDMMLNAVQRSLEYYTENFGPYYHKQARIIEFPRYASFAQAFPGTMPYSEAIGFIADMRDGEGNNIVDAVVAHEMAHQWWAHQEMSAKMQGGTMLTESFSEYSSLMVMKKESTPMKMREFLKYNHERYLRGRSQETDGELPLYKVENQGHIHYGKGSLILYALQDYIGEDSVNAAMREFLEQTRYKGPPYATSMDFLSILEPKVPDSLHYLINDWFKEITLYDYRLKEATYSKREDGKYEIYLSIEAYKVKADSLGNETQETPNDWVYIGLFADDDEEELMMEKKVKFDSENLSFTLVADSLPAKAAIDPRRILIERVYSDNIKTVSEKAL